MIVKPSNGGVGVVESVAEIHSAPPLIVASCMLPELSAAVVPVSSLKFQSARRPIVEWAVLETMSCLDVGLGAHDRPDSNLVDVAVEVERAGLADQEGRSRARRSRLAGRCRWRPGRRPGRSRAGRSWRRR